MYETKKLVVWGVKSLYWALVVVLDFVLATLMAVTNSV